MAVTQAYIANFDESFGNIPSERADVFIGVASPQVLPAVWGDQTDYAVALLTLHTWTLSKTKGRGNVTEEQLGDMRRRFSDKAGSGKNLDPLELTTWGAEYKRLARTKYTGPLVTF